MKTVSLNKVAVRHNAKGVTVTLQGTYFNCFLRRLKVQENWNVATVTGWKNEQYVYAAMDAAKKCKMTHWQKPLTFTFF